MYIIIFQIITLAYFHIIIKTYNPYFYGTNQIFCATEGASY